jgi:hypothetical protein
MDAMDHPVVRHLKVTAHNAFAIPVFHQNRHRV